MELQKNKKVRSVLACYAVALLVYVTAFLIIPFPKEAAAWISFAFTVVAVLVSLYACWLAFAKCSDAMSAVYGYPVFRMGMIYLAAQLAAGIILCVVGSFVSVPYWVALLVGVILLGAAILGVIGMDNARDAAEQVEEAEQVQTKTVVQFQVDISATVRSCTDPAAKEVLENLNQAFLYSDPVSNPATEQIEAQLQGELVELKALVQTGSTEEILAKTAQLQQLLQERNDLCKANK